MLEVIVLGAAGSYQDPGSGTACSGYLVRSGSTTILLDCGYGVLENAIKYTSLTDIDAVFLSHIHPDHCADIFNLNGYLRRYPQKKRVHVLVPNDMRKHLNAYVERWATCLKWKEINGQARVRIGDFTFGFSRTRHGPRTYGCQVTHAEVVVTYTADTGPGWRPSRFVCGTDLLICDAAYISPDEGPPVHLTAEQAGELATNIGARRLMLTHLRPGADIHQPEVHAKKTFDGPVQVATAHSRLWVG
jgi:ribonuclease BN (tRNA processing enzyme)